MAVPAVARAIATRVLMNRAGPACMAGCLAGLLTGVLPVAR